MRLGSSATAFALGFRSEDPAVQGQVNGGGKASDYIQSSVESGIVSGFQLATANGPLCDEPMWGTAFEVNHLAREDPLDPPKATPNPSCEDSDSHMQIPVRDAPVLIALEPWYDWERLAFGRKVRPASTAGRS